MTTENFGHLICDCPTSPPDRSADMLAPLLRPRSVAVIGASKGRTATGGPKLGAATLGYLIDHGFPGDIHPVNPKETELRGRRCYPNVRRSEEHTSELQSL